MFICTRKRWKHRKFSMCTFLRDWGATGAYFILLFAIKTREIIPKSSISIEECSYFWWAAWMFEREKVQGKGVNTVMRDSILYQLVCCHGWRQDGGRVNGSICTQWMTWWRHTLESSEIVISSHCIYGSGAVCKAPYDTMITCGVAAKVAPPWLPRL